MEAGVCLGVAILFHKGPALLLPPPFCINTKCQFAWASLPGNMCNLEDLETLQEYKAIKT